MTKFFDLFKRIDYPSLVERGAKVIDVRTPSEFNQGNIKGSRNIPLSNVIVHAPEIKKDGAPVILCCASGMRSGQAFNILNELGVEAYNGGGWQSLNRKLEK